MLAFVVSMWTGAASGGAVSVLDIEDLTERCGSWTVRGRWRSSVKLQLAVVNTAAGIDRPPGACTVCDGKVRGGRAGKAVQRPSDESDRREQGASSTARRIILGAQLRRLREASGITRGDAGYAIRGSESKISRLELGRVGFKERDVADLLTMYGVTEGTERQSFLEMVKESNQPGWWRRYNDLMPGWFNDYVGLEEAAS